MAYLGLARKYRPQLFTDLVGQEHIAITLTNAIKKGRISQGYLFTGTRGIGKTSTSRILAKVLRCTNPPSPGLSCNKCTDCIEISEGRSVDVLEIDGASNNGVDAVREIRENAKFLPSSGKTKVYIIDEVHMLTTAAFNALLKTLEEPPAHIVFIFATTDPQKIPETVLSRCQRFDFKRVSQKDLTARLGEICASEKLSVTADALAILAREAEGSMRDAISLLDQVLSVAEGKKEVTADALTSALGLVDKKTVLDCVTGILNHDPVLALQALGRIHLHGFDLKQFGREVLRYIRTVMVAKLLEQSKTEISAYMDMSDVDVADVKNLIHARSLDDLDMLFRMLSHGLEDVARSSIPKMVMDVLIIKMASSVDLISVSDLETPESFGGSKSAPAVQAPQAKTAPVQQAAVAPAETKQAPGQKQFPNEFDAGWWKRVVDHVKSAKPLFGSMLEHIGFEAAVVEGSTLMITLGYTKETSFYKDQLVMSVNAEPLAKVLAAHLGIEARLRFNEKKSATAAPASSIVQMEEEQKRKRHDEKKKQVLESDAMKATQQLLGAKLEKLEIKGD